MRHKFVAKTPEYFVYFKVFAADLWGKRTAKARRRNCAVLPLILPHFTGKGQCRFLQWGISIMVYRGRARRGEDVCPIFITCSGAAAGSGDGRCAPKPPLCKGRWLGFRGPGEAQRQRGAVTEGAHQSLPCVKGGAAHIGRRRDCSPAVGIPERPLIMSC